tara:strand:- start:9165 stop:9359 length:195 start_codon:yes stop_codon:yes gene_type:complete
MRNFNDITQNKATGKREYSVVGIANNGAHHSLGCYYSTSERGAMQQAKSDFGDRYTYSAGLSFD